MTSAIRARDLPGQPVRLICYNGRVDPRAYQLMAEVEERHWWWAGRRAILDSLLDGLYARGDLPDGPLVDLGCGVGSNLGVLSKRGRALGYDTAEAAVQAARRRGRNNVFSADLAKGAAGLPSTGPGALGRGTAAIVLMADVIEHLENDHAAIVLARELLAPGGALIVTVPAFQFLWGPADDLNHHVRRYERMQLKTVISSELSIERLSYFNTAMFAPIALVRAVERFLGASGEGEVGLPPAPINAALKALFSSEAALLKRADLPVGVSLLCVARNR